MSLLSCSREAAPENTPGINYKLKSFIFFSLTTVQLTFVIHPLFLAEDNYYGSGSGGGSGFDEDDDAGSGLGPWEVEERHPHRPDMPDYPTGGGVSKSDTSGAGSTSSGGINEFDHTGHKTVPSVEGGGSSSSSGGTSSTAGSGASSRTPEMSITRALLQFFLPLVIAWFGGLFADLL